MKRDPFAVRKQTGKVVIVATVPVGNGTIVKAALKYADSVYYQITKHGDFIQEQGG